MNIYLRKYLVLSSNATPARETSAWGMTGTICSGQVRVKDLSQKMCTIA